VLEIPAGGKRESAAPVGMSSAGASAAAVKGCRLGERESSATAAIAAAGIKVDGSFSSTLLTRGV